MTDPQLVLFLVVSALDMCSVFEDDESFHRKADGGARASVHAVHTRLAQCVRATTVARPQRSQGRASKIRRIESPTKPSAAVCTSTGTRPSLTRRLTVDILRG